MPILPTPGFDPNALTRPAAKPVVTDSSHPSGTRPIIWGDEDFGEGRVPIIGSYGTPDVRRLQITYLDLCRKAPRYEPGVFRSGLLEGLDGDGLVLVEGILSDWRCDAAGNIRRLMLSSTFVTTPNGYVSGGNHIWINRDDMLPGAPNRPGTMHLGDVMGARGHVVGYDDSHGRHRLGVADWQAYTRGLLYSLIDADGRRQTKSMPRHKVDTLTVFSIDAAGECHWRNGDDLAKELAHMMFTVKPLELRVNDKASRPARAPARPRLAE